MNIILHKFLVSFIATEDSILPHYTGSMFRGSFGNALQQTAPKFYKYFFEPTVSPVNKVYSIVQKFPPAPFMIVPVGKRRKIATGDRLQFELTIFGKSVPDEKTLYRIFDRMANAEMGMEQCKVQFVGFEKILNPITRQPAIQLTDLVSLQTENKTLTLKFMTPAGLKFNNEFITDFSYEKIQNYLYRRLYVLNHLYGDKKLKENNPFQTTLKLHELQLFHKNIFRKPANKEKYPMKGWTGQLTYTGTQEQIQTAFPLLKIGEFIHMGSDTSFGFGKYELK